jgi:hypothetical protein
VLEKEIRVARPPTGRTQAISDDLLALVTEMERATEKLAEGTWSMPDYQAAAESLAERNAAVLTSIKKVYFELGTPLLNKAGPYPESGGKRVL